MLFAPDGHVVLQLSIQGHGGASVSSVAVDSYGTIAIGWSDLSMSPLDQFPGVAFTSDNHAYVHRFDREAKTQRVFGLNRVQSTWERVESPNLTLYGADGEHLVFAKWPNNVMDMNWYAQP